MVLPRGRTDYFCIMSWTNSLSVAYVSARSAAVERKGPRTVDPPVTILVSLADHLVDFVISELLADRGHDVPELGSGDEAVVVAIEDLQRRLR